MKFILGITGGSGAGKTTVSDYFREKGIEVIDGDMVARLIMEPGEACLMETVRTFGEDILGENGALIRKKLGQIVFSDSEKLETLNKITHKYITEYFFDKVKTAKSDIVGFDGAVIFESGLDKVCNAIIGVIADEEIRLERITKRDGISMQDARLRVSSQKNNQFYIEKCDFLVYNNGGEEISEQLEEVLKTLEIKIREGEGKVL